MMSVFFSFVGGKLIPSLKRTSDNTRGHNFFRDPDLESTVSDINYIDLTFLEAKLTVPYTDIVCSSWF